MEMEFKQKPWNTIWVIVGAAVVCGALVGIGLRWPNNPLTAREVPATFPFETIPFRGVDHTSPTLHPFLELLKLVFAALIGMVVTAVHKRARRDKPLSRSLEHAQVLLCVAGALMMIIIGNSLPRALGLAGAASIIRFRTPVEDPKDTTILFLLVGLGMATGLGAFGVAGLGTVFVCLFLVVLSRLGEQKPRPMMLEIVASGREFPTAHVQRILAAWQIQSEAREISHGKEATVKYHVTLDPDTPLEVLSEQLMSGGAAGLKSVEWEAPPKKEKG